MFFVASCISTAFYLPEFSPSFRNDAAPPALVTVPEAAMHENNCAVFRQNNIGLTWQVSSVKAVSVPKSVKDRANPHFGLCVLALDCRHIAAALRLNERLPHFGYPAINVSRFDRGCRAAKSISVKCCGPSDALLKLQIAGVQEYRFVRTAEEFECAEAIRASSAITGTTTLFPNCL